MTMFRQPTAIDISDGSRRSPASRCETLPKVATSSSLVLYTGLTNNGEVASNPAKTRGAYNVLVDLVTSLASDLPTNAVKYTLLVERDLDLGPPVKERLADARARAARFLD